MNRNLKSTRNGTFRACIVVAVSGVVLAAMNGCSWFSMEDDEYQQASSVPNLELPPGMSKPVQHDSFKVPGERIPTRAEAAGEMGAGNPASQPVAPIAQDMIIVDDLPSSVWRRLSIVLQRIKGVGVASADEQLGVVRLRYQGPPDRGQALIEVSVKPAAGDKTEVIVHAQASAQNDVARELLARIRQRLV